MRRLVFLTLPFACLLVVQAAYAQFEPMYSTTLGLETENNTPACTTSFAPFYCYLPATYEPPLSTSATNADDGAQTTIVDAVGHIASTPPIALIGSLMPDVSGQPWAGEVICEYQPWFSAYDHSSWGGAVNPYNGHKDIGYDEDIYDATNNPLANSSAPTQDGAMINQGCNIDIVDFYGFIEASQDFNQETTTSSVYQDLENRYNSNTQTYPMQFAIMEDKGAFQTECNASVSNTAEETCIENALESDMSGVYSNYIQAQLHPGLYWTDNGVNVVAIFASCSDFSPSATPPGKLVCLPNSNNEDDWQTIWTYLMNTVGLGAQYNMKFIFEYGNFGYPEYASSGEFAWPQPSGDGFANYTETQFWWCDSGGLPCNGEGSGSGSYLDRFYTDAVGAVQTGQVAIGLLYKGFDDSNASWGSDRVIAQQCGQVLLDTANELTYEANPDNISYWASHKMPYMQVATWNDYEEGTEVESGISNCYDGVTDLIVEPQGESGGSPTLEWSLSATGAANVGGVEYATSNTINNFTIWVAPQSQPDNISVYKTVSGTQHSYYPFTPDLPAGNYYVYVEMVGKPMIQNAMSSGLGFSVP